MNIEAFEPLAEFHARMEAMIGQLKTTPRAPGVDAIHYPGEIEAMNAESNAQGLQFPADTLADLERVANETKIPLDIFR